MTRRKRFKKEEHSENCCFECKDGGELRICDYRRCVKVYHPKCVGKDKSFMVAETKWNCDWHFCHLCRNASQFYCFCCPSAVCKKCLSDAQFAVVRRNKGLCNSCIELVWLLETKKDVDSNGCKIDVNDPETTEIYFKWYWQLTKRKECLTLENVISAYDLMKKGEMHKRASNAFESDEGEEDTKGFEDESLFNISDYNDSIDTETDNLPFHWNRIKMRSQQNMYGKKEKIRTNEEEGDDGLAISSLRRSSEGNGTSCHMPLEQLQREAPEAPIVIANAQVAESSCKESKRADERIHNNGLTESSQNIASAGNRMPCHMNYSPDVAAVSKSHQEAVPVVIIDVKDELTKDNNPLSEQLDFFANLQVLFDESVKDLPGSSQQPPHTPEQNEALDCLRQCCSMSFEQLMHHDLKDCFLSSVNFLLTYGYFPENMFGMVASLQLNFLSNISIYSRCLEDVKKADEEQERATSLTIELADKKNRFYQIKQSIRVKLDKIDELKKQLAEERKFVASLQEETMCIYESSKASRDALYQSIQRAKTLEKRKGSSQQLMREIKDSWTKFQIESSKLLKGYINSSF